MNERIKQLAIQAGVYVGDDMWFADELNPKTQMFAQLIVAECLMKANGAKIRGESIDVLIRNIEEHFGVKD